MSSEDQVEASRDLVPSTEPLSIQEGAQALTDSRGDEREYDEISYRKSDGERSSPRLKISREQAVEDLIAYREGKVAAEREQTTARVREHVDSVRQGLVQGLRQQAGLVPAQQYTAQPQQPVAKQTAQEPPVVTQMRTDPNWHLALKAFQNHYAEQLQQLDAAISERWAAGVDASDLTAQWQQVLDQKEQVDFLERAEMFISFGKSPRCAAALADLETFQEFAKHVEQFRQAYIGGLQEMKKDAEDVLSFCTQLIVEAIPEVSHCKTRGEVASVIQTLNHNNPVRAERVSNHYLALNRAYANAVKCNSEIAIAEREAFQKYQLEEANKFRLAEREFLSPETQKQVAEEAISYLKTKGLSEDQILHLWNTSREFNSATFQHVLWDALRYQRLQRAGETLRYKRVAPVTQVLKPGSSETWINKEPERLPDSMSAKVAANILINRRAKRR